jgi:hypothetical protein
MELWVVSLPATTSRLKNMSNLTVCQMTGLYFGEDPGHTGGGRPRDHGESER